MHTRPELGAGRMILSAALPSSQAPGRTLFVLLIEFSAYCCLQKRFAVVISDEE